MNDKINFTGISNVGSVYTRAINYYNPLHYIGRNYFTVTLTDDAAGNDFSEFKKYLKKYKPSAQFDFVQDKITLSFYTEINSINPLPKLYLKSKEIIPSDSTLPLFEYFAKLTRKIRNLPDEKLYVPEDYKQSSLAMKNIFGDPAMVDLFTNSSEKKAFLSNVYSPNFSKHGANSINKNIQKIMEDYFA